MKLVRSSLTVQMKVSETDVELADDLSETLNSLIGRGDARTLILIAYSPGDYRDENLHFFIKKGGIIDNEHYYYVFIVSNSWDPTLYQRDILSYSNTEILIRENYGLDFCSWKIGLHIYKNRGFKSFIVLNASIRGHFLPVWANHVRWPDLFVRPLDANTGLPGLTVNCDGNMSSLHIQSMILSFKKNVLPLIIQTFRCLADRTEVINTCEKGTTQDILNAGYNIHITQKYWQNHEFRDRKATRKKCGKTMDVFYPNRNFGIDIHPLETIFVKTNRRVNPLVLSKYTGWIPETRMQGNSESR